MGSGMSSIWWYFLQTDFFFLMSQSPRENNISDLSSVTNILWVFHQKSRQCCVARRGLAPAPSPTSRLPFSRPVERKGCYYGQSSTRAASGGGNFKQDAPGRTGRGSRYLWPVRESHRCTFTPTRLQRTLFPSLHLLIWWSHCWQDTRS